MKYVIPPADIVSLPVLGSGDEVFPIHRIYCVGRNYADHAREMGHNPDEEPPFFFLKPVDVIVADGGQFPYPSRSQNVQHEVELVVALARGGSEIPVDEALDHVLGYGVGIDMTRRDLQNEAKGMGRPWDPGKSFDHSAPCSGLRRVAEIGHPDQGEISITIDGQIRQQADLNQMIWKVPQVISELSGLFELQAGDLIFTGTPAGVGPVQRGERLVAQVEGVAVLTVDVV